MECDNRGLLSGSRGMKNVWRLAVSLISRLNQVVLLAIQEHHELVKSYIVGKTIATTLLVQHIWKEATGTR